MVETTKEKPYRLLDADFIDHYENLKRGAQIITPKDLGAIVAYTGVGPESVVVDAGAGSGGCALFLAHLVKHVTTYDVNPDHIRLVEKNRDRMGLTNVEIKERDITTGVDETEVDLFVVDLIDPERTLPTVRNALKIGGFLVTYCPQIPQVQAVIRDSQSLYHLQTIEMLERSWIIDEKRARPNTRMTGHTGFLSFFRRIS